MPSLRRCTAILAVIALFAGCQERPAPAPFPVRKEVRQPAPDAVLRVVDGLDPRTVARPAGTGAPGTLDGPPIELLHVDEVPLGQVCQILTRLMGVNVTASAEARARPISLYLVNATPRMVIDTIGRLYGLGYRHDPGIVRFLTADENRNELVLCRDDETRLYRLRHASASAVAELVATLMPEQVSYARPSEEASFGHVGTDGDNAMGGTGTTSGTTTGATTATGTGTGSISGVNRQSFSSTPGSGSASAGNQSASRTGVQTGTTASIRSGSSGAGARTGAQAQAPATVSVFLRDNCVAVRSMQDPLHREIAGIVSALDTPTRQVLLEVKILRVTLGEGFDSLFQFAFADQKNYLSTLSSFTQASSAVTFAFLDDHIASSIQLLQSSNRLQVAATPMLLCANNAPAEFFSGVQRMITVNYDNETRYNSSGDSTSTVDIARAVVEQREIGTKVRIKPSINADATVTLRFLLETGQVNDGAASITQVVNGEVLKLPIDTVSSERTESIVVARHGHAVVMGGLISESVRRNKDGLPWLSDIPVLGLLFSSRSDRSERTETVVMIIPHIMASAEQGGEISGEVNRRLSTHPWVRHDETALTDWDEQAGKLRTLEPQSATGAAAHPATAAEAR